MYYRKSNNIIISKSFKTASSTLHQLLKKYAQNEDSEMIHDHFTIKEFREKFDLKQNEVIGIVGIRNPWDYVSSAYHWSLVNGECPRDYTFGDFVFKESEFNWQKQLKWWDVNEIDDVIVFEDVENEINRIAISYGIPEIVGKSLGHYKRTKNSYIDYRGLYTPNRVNYVAEIFEEQIEFFNNKFNIEYTFDEGFKYSRTKLQ